MSLLSKKDILTANDIKTKEFEVAEWGGSVCLRVISGSDRDKFEQAVADKKIESIRSKFLVMTICDKDGEKLFTEEEWEELNKKASPVLTKVFDAAWELNAFSPAAVETLGNDSPSDQSVSST